MAAGGKTFLDDPDSLRALVNMMAEPDRAEYKAYTSLALEACFPGRKMVVYTLRGSKPTDLDVISFGELKVDWDMGPTCSVQDAYGEQTLMCIPKRLRPRDLFLHIPQNFQLRYKGKQASDTGVEFASHYAVLVKTRSRETLQIDSHTYCCTLNNFRARFPSIRVGY